MPASVNACGYEDADFFDAAHHPTTEFVARMVDPITDAAPGQPKSLRRGDFILRAGSPARLSFPPSSPAPTARV